MGSPVAAPPTNRDPVGLGIPVAHVLHGGTHRERGGSIPAPQGCERTCTPRGRSPRRFHLESHAVKSDIFVVAGAGGFIGGHLVDCLLKDGARVRAVDKKPLDDWWQRHAGVENQVLDLQDLKSCRTALAGATEVYNLAADM